MKCYIFALTACLTLSPNFAFAALADAGQIACKCVCDVEGSDNDRDYTVSPSTVQACNEMNGIECEGQNGKMGTATCHPRLVPQPKNSSSFSDANVDAAIDLISKLQ